MCIIEVKIDIIERENYISKIILYFIKLNKEKKYKKDSLPLDEIKVLNSILLKALVLGVIFLFLNI